MTNEEDKQKPAEYPEVPDGNNLQNYDLGIQEDEKGISSGQIWVFSILVLVLTIIIAVYLST